jgi:undecaprenyl pyrophosphate phosphatase UppP
MFTRYSQEQQQQQSWDVSLLLFTHTVDAVSFGLLDLTISLFLLSFELRLYWFLMFGLLQLVQELAQPRKRARHLDGYMYTTICIFSKTQA